MADITAEVSLPAAAAGSAAPASKLAQKEQSLLRSQDSASFSSGRRAAGRPREEGAVLRVVRAVTGSAVKPQLVSQSSLPAVEHAAPTKPSQPPAGAAAAATKPTRAMTAAEKEAAAAAEHTAMLNRYKAAWKVTPQDSFWTRLYKHVEWRLFWTGHLSAVIVLDYEERVFVLLLYMAMVGLVMYESCRRIMGLAGL